MNAPSELPCPDVPVPADDMTDSPEEVAAHWPQLGPALAACETLVYDTYRRHDDRAMRHQKIHRSLVILAAVCGAAAVLLAIFQMSHLFPGHTLRVLWLEAVMVVVALVAVAVGLYVNFSRKWLVEREKAERCRSLKFFFLLYGRGTDDEEARKWLTERVAAVRGSGAEGLEKWVTREERDEPPPLPPVMPSDAPRVAALVRYYRSKRLCYQRDRYFRKAAHRERLWERLTKYFPLACFYLSVCAALLHFGHDLATHDPEHAATGHSPLSTWLLLAAAGLPVLGAAGRTYRTAHEFGRNSLRYEATANDLASIEDKLQAAPGPAESLALLVRAEDLLEAERLEWLRLMLEAESFG